ncbi:MAG: L,D-transpeptidase family protein [Deferribacteraceae bacterium]|jgi:murein L,D-transpeptidase YafK|nr:L,D-transpeptidase family protein [Deferribacteraceae bacterium]
MKTILIIFTILFGYILSYAQEDIAELPVTGPGEIGVSDTIEIPSETSDEVETPAASEAPIETEAVIAPERDNLSTEESDNAVHYPLASDFEPPAGALIANVYTFGSAKHLVVLVAKQAKKLYVLNVEGDGQERIAGVNIISGRFAGAKRLEGDKRTPDGVYYTTSFLSAERLHKLYGDYADIYGFGAFPTNYPNPSDRALGYTGYGIWLHGLNPLGHKDATEGCVAMENTGYEEIKDYLSTGQTVIFSDQLLWEDEAAYARKRGEAFDKLNAFFDSWRDGDYETYKNFIHPKYKSYAAASADKYLAGKKSLMRLYPKKTIELNNIKIYSVDDNATVYDLDQLYCAENTLSYARKKYYFARDGGEQRLISEEIIAKDARPRIEAAARKFAEEWVAAWESREIERYASFYSPAVNTDKWRSYKEGIFAATGEIDVEMSGFKWRAAGGNRYIISFLQEYKADALSDRGRKTLVIKGCPGGFTIESEKWERSK